MSKARVFKVLISGEGGVGKTTLMYRYIEGTFRVDTRMTIGVEFHLKELDIEDQKLYLQIWDFGGQDRFRFLLKNYAKGALLLFDLTRPITLQKLDEWVDICRSDDPNIPIILIGSKSDLSKYAMIQDGFIKELKEKYNIFDYVKVSSKSGQNVSQVFDLLAQEILKYTSY
jgi:small GTP-binding protein